MPSLQTALPPELADNVIRVWICFNIDFRTCFFLIFCFGIFHFFLASIHQSCSVSYLNLKMCGFCTSYIVSALEELASLVIRYVSLSLFNSNAGPKNPIPVPKSKWGPLATWAVMPDHLAFYVSPS